MGNRTVSMPLKMQPADHWHHLSLALIAACHRLEYNPTQLQRQCPPCGNLPKITDHGTYTLVQWEFMWLVQMYLLAQNTESLHTITIHNYIPPKVDEAVQVMAACAPPGDGSTSSSIIDWIVQQLNIIDVGPQGM